MFHDFMVQRLKILRYGFFGISCRGKRTLDFGFGGLAVSKSPTLDSAVGAQGWLPGRNGGGSSDFWDCGSSASRDFPPGGL